MGRVRLGVLDTISGDCAGLTEFHFALVVFQLNSILRILGIKKGVEIIFVPPKMTPKQPDVFC